MSGSERWGRYFAKGTGRRVRRDFLDVLGTVGKSSGRVAIDLGAGDGTETRHLLEAGWEVFAVDATPGLRGRVVAGLADDPGGRLTAVDRRFAEVESLPLATFVYAGLSLPFATPGEQRHILALAADALQPGGVIAAHVFGERDDWAQRAGVAVTTPEETARLFRRFDDVGWVETEYDGPSGLGPKHWHLRFVTGRARTAAEAGLGMGNEALPNCS